MRILKFVFAGLLLTIQANASISHQDKSLVVAEIVRLYSQGQGDDQFKVTEDDVWALKYLSETSPACPVLVQGYANKPSYRGTSLYQIYVCIKSLPTGEKYAELADEVQIAD